MHASRTHSFITPRASNSESVSFAASVNALIWCASTRSGDCRSSSSSNIGTVKYRTKVAARVERVGGMRRDSLDNLVVSFTNDETTSGKTDRCMFRIGKIITIVSVNSTKLAKPPSCLVFVLHLCRCHARAFEFLKKFRLSLSRVFWLSKKNKKITYTLYRRA